MATIKADAALRAVKKLERERQIRQDYLEGRILGAIDNARAAGATWKQVAEALEAPLQTVYRKYGENGTIRAKVWGNSIKNGRKSEKRRGNDH